MAGSRVAKNEDRSPEHSSASSISFLDSRTSIVLTFEGEPDENGEVIPSYAHDSIRNFLDYYFEDKTIISSAVTERESIFEGYQAGFIRQPRFFPYGDSGEMVALFLWSLLQPFTLVLSKCKAALVSVEVQQDNMSSGTFSLSSDEAIAFFLGNTMATKSSIVEILKNEANILPRASKALLQIDSPPYASPEVAMRDLRDVIDKGLLLVYQ